MGNPDVFFIGAGVGHAKTVKNSDLLLDMRMLVRPGLQLTCPNSWIWVLWMTYRLWHIVRTKPFSSWRSWWRNGRDDNFECFLIWCCFMCFPCFCGTSLKFCFNVLSGFKVSSSLRCFCYGLSRIPYDFSSMLRSFRCISWVSITNQEKNLNHSVHQARLFPRCILHNYFRHCSPGLFRSWICPCHFSRLTGHNTPCVFSFYQANFPTKSQTSNNEVTKNNKE